MEKQTTAETKVPKTAEDIIIEACGEDAHFIHPEGKPVIMDVKGVIAVCGDRFKGLLERGDPVVVEGLIARFKEYQKTANDIKALGDGSFETLKSEGDRQLAELQNQGPQV